MICTFLEYVAQHTPAPATIRNKVSHVRTYLRMSGRNTKAIDHPRVRMALDAFDRDKSYVPRVKGALPVPAMPRAITHLPDSHIGSAVAAAVLYYGTLRQSEVVPPSIRAFDRFRHPTRADIATVTGGLRLTVKWAKNMQKVGQSRSVVLPWVSDRAMCPVTALQNNILAVPTKTLEDPLIMFPDTCRPVPATLGKK